MTTLKSIPTALQIGLLSLWTAVTLLSLSAEGAKAQYRSYHNPYTGTNWNNPMSSLADTMIWSSIQRKVAEDAIQKRYGQGNPAPTTRGSGSQSAAPTTQGNNQPAAPKHPITASDFKPAETRLLPDKLIDSNKDLTEEQRKGLRTLYQTGFREFEKRVRKNNVANAMAFVFGASMEIVAQKEGTDADFKMLVNALNDLLADSPKFKTLSAREKQTMYEACIITGTMMIALKQLGAQQNNEEMKKQAKELAQSVLGKAAAQ